MSVDVTTVHQGDGEVNGANDNKSKHEAHYLEDIAGVDEMAPELCQVYINKLVSIIDKSRSAEKKAGCTIDFDGQAASRFSAAALGNSRDLYSLPREFVVFQVFLGDVVDNVDRVTFAARSSDGETSGFICPGALRTI
jgi:hypothetical protein